MIYPMFFMVVLTIIIGCIAFYARVKSVKLGLVKAQDYMLMDANHYPEFVIKTTRCLNNQFEVPVLFYVACLSYLALNISNGSGLYIAWAFVIFRALHAFIHLTYNNLLHRLVVFWLSVIVVLVIWINLIIKMA